MSTRLNPVGLNGISWVEFASPEPDRLHNLFVAFGFSRRLTHEHLAIELYEQGEMKLLLNREPVGFAATFAKLHGPSICSMGWLVDDSDLALKTASERGANAFTASSPYGAPAVFGIGESLIYLPDGDGWLENFVAHPEPVEVPEKGFTRIDHLTNNVQKGTMQTWARFYKEVFGFTEVRYFDIRGAQTGLTSYALRSPDGSFCIPINEGSEDKSQIEEYLREYRGPGIQHLAFLTDDLLASLDALEGSDIQTLDIDDEYYQAVFDRVPGVTEDHERIKAHQVLVDGDEQGYLLQIFTRNIIGPIFIEMIQRKNHLSFGEGNFGALFRSIERDQQRRGVL
jgi:4-hydroxyphenylpyruvate dioxygenase